MHGRYGMDKLNIGLLVLWLIINIINTIFFRNLILQMVTYLIVILIIFRCLSRNIPQRSKENEIYLKYYYKVKPYVYKIKPLFARAVEWFRLQKRRFIDRKTHRYVKCPYCKATIRVPFRKGKHTVNCPRCREDFKTNIMF